MATLFTVNSGVSTQIQGPATITNGSGISAYYRTDNASVPVVSDSTLASGATIRTDVPLWFSSASSSLLVTSDLDPVYTQTYSTATRTHSNDTATDMATTAATNSSPYGFAGAAQADAIATKFNALRVDVDNVKGVLNAVIDDLQARSLAR